MGISNLRYGLESKLARFQGTLATKKAEIERIEANVLRLTQLREDVTELERLIDAAVMLIKNDCPLWNSDEVKPIRPSPERINPFPRGELGRAALAVLREDGGDLNVPAPVLRI